MTPPRPCHGASGVSPARTDGDKDAKSGRSQHPDLLKQLESNERYTRHFAKRILKERALHAGKKDEILAALGTWCRSLDNTSALYSRHRMEACGCSRPSILTNRKCWSGACGPMTTTCELGRPAFSGTGWLTNRRRCSTWRSSSTTAGPASGSKRSACWP